MYGGPDRLVFYREASTGLSKVAYFLALDAWSYVGEFMSVTQWHSSVAKQGRPLLAACSISSTHGFIAASVVCHFALWQATSLAGSYHQLHMQPGRSGKHDEHTLAVDQAAQIVVWLGQVLCIVCTCTLQGTTVVPCWPAYAVDKPKLA